MSWRSLALVLLTGFLVSVHGPSLQAQSGSRGEKADSGKETEVDKEKRKGLFVSNSSTAPWIVGMEKDAELKGKIQIMVLNEDGTRFVKNKKITELKPGMEFTIQADAEVLFSPEPPSTLLWKTGDFTADLYLRDSSKKTGKRLYFTMKRNAGGPTENKTCTIEFPSNIDPAKWGDVFYLPQGEGAFEHKYMSPLIISGAELNPVPPPPPRKLKAR